MASLLTSSRFSPCTAPDTCRGRSVSFLPERLLRTNRGTCCLLHQKTFTSGTWPHCQRRPSALLVCSTAQKDDASPTTVGALESAKARLAGVISRLNSSLVPAPDDLRQLFTLVDELCKVAPDSSTSGNSASLIDGRCAGCMGHSICAHGLCHGRSSGHMTHLDTRAPGRTGQAACMYHLL